jgi:hypothetical protein
MKFQLHLPQPEQPPQAPGVMPMVYVTEALVWQYKLLDLDLEALDLQGEGALDAEPLNRLGKEGWELVTVLLHGGRATCFFKRAET